MTVWHKQHHNMLSSSQKKENLCLTAKITENLPPIMMIILVPQMMHTMRGIRKAMSKGVMMGVTDILMDMCMVTHALTMIITKTC